jgi:hypothetical protein
VRAPPPTCTHSHYRPGTQKYSESLDGGHSTFASFDRLAIRFSHNTPQDISGVFCENRLSSRSKLPNLERAPFWVYCSLLWVHVRARRPQPPGLVVETYTPLETQPAVASSQAGTSPCWLVLRNQPARLGLRTQPRRLGLTGDPAPMARSWDPAMQASSPPRTSLHRWFLRTSPAGWVSPQTQPRRLGPENQPAWRSNAVPAAMATVAASQSACSTRSAKCTIGPAYV